MGALYQISFLLSSSIDSFTTGDLRPPRAGVLDPGHDRRGSGAPRMPRNSTYQSVTLAHQLCKVADSSFTPTLERRLDAQKGWGLGNQGYAWETELDSSCSGGLCSIP